MWTTENRPRYDRKGLRYPSDLTDAEWDLVKPLIPRAKRGGRKREVVVRDVLNGVLYVLSTRMSVARLAERPAAAQYRAWLSATLGLRRDPDENP